MKRNDNLWKSILEDVFEDFLKFFFPDADELFDYSRQFEYLDKELEQLFPPEKDQYAPRYVDKLIKVYTKAGKEEWILVHVEVQGYQDHLFADRMFTYYYRIWDKYRQRTTAVAILTDENKNFRPTRFEQSFLGTKLVFEFNSFKILDQSEDALSESDNLFAQVILTVMTALRAKSLDDEDLFSLKVQLARRLFSKQIPKYKIGKLMIFLKFYIRLESDELNEKFEFEIKTLTNNTSKTMGIEEFLLHQAKEEGKEEGIEQGVQRGRIERNISFTQTLLSETSFSIEEVARLVGVSVGFVQNVKAAM